MTFNHKSDKPSGQCLSPFVKHLAVKVFCSDRQTVTQKLESDKNLIYPKYNVPFIVIKELSSFILATDISIPSFNNSVAIEAFIFALLAS